MTYDTQNWNNEWPKMTCTARFTPFEYNKHIYYTHTKYKKKNEIKTQKINTLHAQTCTVFPLALAGGLHAGISGLADPLLKGTHLSAAMPPHHLQQIPDVSWYTRFDWCCPPFFTITPPIFLQIPLSLSLSIKTNNNNNYNKNYAKAKQIYAMFFLPTTTKKKKH